MTGPSRASHELFRWRAELDVSQAEAAQQLELEQSHYSEFERGARRPGLKRALTIHANTGGRVSMEMWFQPEPGK